MQKMCQCENIDHFEHINPITKTETATPPKHTYLAVPAGNTEIAYIGVVCDDCANTCHASNTAAYVNVIKNLF